MTIYRNGDVNPSVLENELIAIIGYGRLGQAQALNMREQGLKVITANHPADISNRAHQDGFDVFSIEQASEKGTILLIFLKDKFLLETFDEKIKPQLKAEKTIVFSESYHLRHGFIQPPKVVDVILLESCMSGKFVRKLFTKDAGVPCLLCIYQNATGKAKEKALALAWGIGATRVGVVEISVSDETELDYYPKFISGKIDRYLSSYGNDPLRVFLKDTSFIERATLELKSKIEFDSWKYIRRGWLKLNKGLELYSFVTLLDKSKHLYNEMKSAYYDTQYLNYNNRKELIGFLNQIEEFIEHYNEKCKEDWYLRLEVIKKENKSKGINYDDIISIITRTKARLMDESWKYIKRDLVRLEDITYKLGMQNHMNSLTKIKEKLITKHNNTDYINKNERKLLYKNLNILEDYIYFLSRDAYY